MNTEEAIQELQRIQQILPELVVVLSQSKEEDRKIRKYEKAGYYRELYGISRTTYQDRRDGIREQIKGEISRGSNPRPLGRQSSFLGLQPIRILSPAIYPKRAPAYDDQSVAWMLQLNLEG